MKSGNLNFLEPSGPLQACNGTALPLPFTFTFTFTSKNYSDDEIKKSEDARGVQHVRKLGGCI